MNAAILDRIRQQRIISSAQPSPRAEVYTCNYCKDMRWIIDPHQPIGIGRSSSAIPCPRCRTVRVTETGIAINGQRTQEMTIRLADIQPGAHNQQAINAVNDLLTDRSGLLTLTGLPGRGKSHLLHALTNELRLIQVQVEYAQINEILDHLRAGFSAGDYDKRWRNLLDLPALVIDDLDQFKPTDWANERLIVLVEQRWRDLRQKATVFALTTQTGQLLAQTALPERVVRRLTDAQSVVVTMYKTHPDLAGGDVQRSNGAKK